MHPNFKYVILQITQRGFSLEFDDYSHHIIEYTDNLTNLLKYGDDENNVNEWIRWLTYCLDRDKYFDLQLTNDQNTTLLIMTTTLYEQILNRSLYMNDYTNDLYLNDDN